VALSKNNFADYIFNNVENFNDFNFKEFQEVFKAIENILKHHSELPVELPIQGNLN
jgi:hypothetical protein